MEDASLLGGLRRFPRVPLIGGLGIALIVLILSIVAIILSSVAIHKAENSGEVPENIKACYFEADGTLPITAAPVIPIPTVASSSVLIKNATIWVGDDSSTVLEAHDILIVDGIIHEIAIGIEHEANSTYNVLGAFVTPGIVDMHSHLGVYAFPEDSFANDDGNELTDPTTAFVRVVDALDPLDPAIEHIRAGGVTTSQVLPGSGNVIGGQAALIKMKGVSVSNMLIPNVNRTFKMAMGENPKRVYGSQGKMPSTRMGNIWVLRDQFSSALAVKTQQDQWDCLGKAGAQAESRPFDASLEPLISILRGEALLNIHCYRVQDFEAALRVSDEFGFKISAFHHALEAYKIPKAFAERNITIATFADMWGFKIEGYEGSVHAATTLTDAGVKVAFKSDHPVLDAKYLLYEAAKGHHFGLEANLALHSITSVPAKAIGLFDRVGSIELGKHADVVVWDRHPLVLGAEPIQVFIEGLPYLNNSITAAPSSLLPPPLSPVLKPAVPGSCASTNTEYAVIGASAIWTLNSDTPISDGVIIVRNGNIDCVGTQAACPTTGIANTFDVDGGVIVPGLVSADGAVGMIEVEAESASGDGVVESDDGSEVFAVDGLQVGNRRVLYMWQQGVTTQIAIPLGSQLISGVSAAFYTHGATVDDSILVEQSALHINIGNQAKGNGLTASVSGQFSMLRSAFDGAANGSSITKVLSGELPVVFRVHQADQIGSVLRFVKQYNLKNVTIIGGAEAYIQAQRLADADINVILSPLRQPPSLWETLRANTTNAGQLATAGVAVGIAQSDPSEARLVRFEAGYGVIGGLSWLQALQSITINVAQAFGLPTGTGTITVNTPANFVAFTGDPLALGSQVQLISLRNYVECNPTTL